MRSDVPDKPVPWEFVDAGAARVASNGDIRVVMLDAGGRLFARRAIKRSGCGKPAAEVVLPQLNALAGEILAHLDMPADQLRDRLIALAGLAHVDPQKHVEWAVAELDGVRVYCNGAEVVVTRADLSP